MMLDGLMVVGVVVPVGGSGAVLVVGNTAGAISTKLDVSVYAEKY